MNNLVLSENEMIGNTVYKLDGYDPEGSKVTFGIIGSNHFHVDSETGYVKLISNLDREVNDTLSFLISIKDQILNGEDSKDDNIVQIPVTVIISDENDNIPQFKNIPYVASVLENATVGSTVFSEILVTDIDAVGETLNITCLSKIKTEQNVFISSTSDCEQFELKIVESNNKILRAIVILRSELDYNDKNIYNLIIEATDGFHKSSSTLELRIIDVQNRPPIFDGSYSAEVFENITIEALVMTFVAKDGDNGQPRKIVYDLITNPMEYFLLESETGVLRTAKPLDREAHTDTLGIVTISVRASELEDNIPLHENYTSTIMHAIITIKDNNDSPPIFNRNSYVVSLAEDTPTGTLLPLDIHINDPDMGTNSIYSLRLVDLSGVMDIHPKLAFGATRPSIRITNNSLDYENPNHRKFIVLIIAEEIETQERFSSTATITITVTDVNDNHPIFLRDLYSIEVFETASIGDVIDAITATDSDSGIFGNVGIRYSLSGAGSKLFRVNEISGEISIADCTRINHNIIGSPGQFPCLDFESQSEYFLTYKATDNEGLGHSSVVSLRILIIDKNDSPPQCLKQIYRASIDEGANTFEPSLQIHVSDKDLISDTYFTIIGDGFIHDILTIDNQTGNIDIKNSSFIDVNFLQTDNLLFSVQVFDGVFYTYCNVSISIRDVNNHAPFFEQELFEISVAENMSIGHTILQIQAKDHDRGINADIRYRIQTGSLGIFEINKISGIISIKQKIIYEQFKSFQMIIVASDMGTPSLSGYTNVQVTILKSNNINMNFTPFTQYIDVLENIALNTKVHELASVDLKMCLFQHFDTSNVEHISIIDRNGINVHKSEHVHNPFNIDSNGTVSLQSTFLNRTKYAQIRIPVVISCQYDFKILGDLIITIIGVNKLNPEFPLPWTKLKPYLNFAILEELPIGSVLTRISAYDNDTAIDYYSIENNAYFEIDNKTGLIRSKSRIDFEYVNKISFNLTVYDCGTPQLNASAEVMVDVININDNSPMFNCSSFTFDVLENSPNGIVVGSVIAYDADNILFGDITYMIKGDDAKYFHIDPMTGLMTVTNASILDHERKQTINFIAVAFDGAPLSTRKASSIPVVINILDKNDNTPKFNQPLYEVHFSENAVYLEHIPLIKFEAIDDDDGLNGVIQYSIISNDLFTNNLILHPQNGILYVNRGFDKLTAGEYVLDVEARDGLGEGPNFDRAKLRINISPTNQFQPVFLVPQLSNSTIYLQKSINNVVFIAKAIDLDTASGISYHFLMNNRHVQSTTSFTLNEHTGELHSSEYVFDNKSKYELVLVANDNGKPYQFESLIFLTINVYDQKLENAIFSEDNKYYEFSVYENENTGVYIGTIHSLNSKFDSTLPIYYYILMGNEDYSFSINTSGDIYTNRSIDREKTNTYRLYIKASNRPSLEKSDIDLSIKALQNDSTITCVVINILDLNDNAPNFYPDYLMIAVSASSLSGEIIAILNVTDADVGANAKFEIIVNQSNLYKFGKQLVGAINPNPFNVNSYGHITTTCNMVEYNQDRFELDVIAKDLTFPNHISKTQVHVWVFSPNQLIKLVLSKPVSKVNTQKEDVIQELKNVTNSNIIVFDIRPHLLMDGQIRNDWCDLFFLAVDKTTKMIIPVETVIKSIDAHYDLLREYYNGYAIENVLPAYSPYINDKIDVGIAGIYSLLVILFLGMISFSVIYCFLKKKSPIVTQTRLSIVNKQVKKLEDQSTTDNPLWIEQKLKLYEEQELTMQVFCEPEMSHSNTAIFNSSQESIGNDNTYATLQPVNSNVSNNYNNTASINEYATLQRESIPTPIINF